jgi:hypothetical protein
MTFGSACQCGHCWLLPTAWNTVWSHAPKISYSILADALVRTFFHLERPETTTPETGRTVLTIDAIAARLPNKANEPCKSAPALLRTSADIAGFAQGIWFNLEALHNMPGR